VLGRHIARETSLRENVGVLLPNMTGTVITFFALHSHGRIPAMLNYSAGATNIKLACQAASIKLVYTSSQFIQAGGLQSLIQMFQEEHIQVVYVENVRDKLSGFLFSLAPRWAYKHLSEGVRPSDPAVILFTSGSEGVPKGVVLSHKNIQSNRYQICSRIDFNSQDIVFNAMPLFHAFGLTAGTIMPLLSGLKVFLYPSPLHYRVIPELVYDNNATILFGTDTFLSGYARCAHPYDFYSLRYVVAGAEKLKPETARIWCEKFGVRILEGYGTTETSPVLTVNTPMQSKKGSVGRFLPAIRYRVQPVPGISEGGRLFVSAPSVMLGYLFPDRPGQICPPEDGWYDTGDIVLVDEEGFVHIQGRAKRFAKIAGEMVSLVAVESHISTLWPGQVHAALAVQDERKGEQIVLVTQREGVKRSDIVAYFQGQKIAEIYLPRTIVFMEVIPLLSTGKTDYVTLQEMLKSKP
jgi:acyl-[acyl-carrier-protein]-phospholipid O-acyltransferase / long-chain-fatty-acid--[acyl-carrier-protein] ligase